MISSHDARILPASPSFYEKIPSYTKRIRTGGYSVAGFDFHRSAARNIVLRRQWDEGRVRERRTVFLRPHNIAIRILCRSYWLFLEKMLKNTAKVYIIKILF